VASPERWGLQSGTIAQGVSQLKRVAEHSLIVYSDIKRAWNLTAVPSYVAIL